MIVVSLVAVFLNKRHVDFASRTLAEPLIAGIFREFRSPAFREAIDRVRQIAPDEQTQGLAGLPEPARDCAYSVCYFFEYVGHEVAFGHVSARSSPPSGKHVDAAHRTPARGSCRSSRTWWSW